MTSATPVNYPPGVTIILKLSDLLNEYTNEPVLTDSGAVVTFQITDLSDVEMSSGTATATDDDWQLLVDTPEITGNYVIKVIAVADGATGKWKDRFNVSAF